MSAPQIRSIPAKPQDGDLPQAIPLCVPDLSGREAEYLRQCIESTLVSSVGPFVGRFESMVAAAAGTPAAAATSSGTAGLHVALVTVGVGRDDLVILPTYTFIASANAIAHAGATPWLLDIDPSSWTLAPEMLHQQLESQTRRDGERLLHVATGRRVAAVMPVHTLGIPADMDGLVAIAREFDLPVVADAAAALGVRYRDRAIGAAGADLSVFSFNGNKTVTTGGGGAVVGDAGIIERVRHLSTTARCGAEYDHDAVGYNYRMTNIEAAVGCAQLERLEMFLAAKRSIDRRYRAELNHLAGVHFFPQPGWGESACWFSGVVAPDAGAAKALRMRLNEARIDARPFWKPMHYQAPFRDAPIAATPVADGLWARVVTLPCSSNLTEVQQARVIDVVRAAWQ